jgi:formate hydrogenlyase subunit 6/NADH:ubiquinone oxidoreductase subunit I
MGKPTPRIDLELCNRCGLCVEACTCHTLKLGENGPVLPCADEPYPACLEDQACDCLCEEVCPTGAIQCSYEIVLDQRQADAPAGQAPPKAEHSKPEVS